MADIANVEQYKYIQGAFSKDKKLVCALVQAPYDKFKKIDFSSLSNIDDGFDLFVSISSDKCIKIGSESTSNLNAEQIKNLVGHAIVTYTLLAVGGTFSRGEKEFHVSNTQQTPLTIVSNNDVKSTFKSVVDNGGEVMVLSSSIVRNKPVTRKHL